MIDSGNNRLEAFDEEGDYGGQFGSVGSGAGQFEFTKSNIGRPVGLAPDTRGDLWVSDPANNRVEKWTTTVRPDAEARLTQPGWTIEYDVPVSGAGAPSQMTSSEVGKWAQAQKSAPEQAAVRVLEGAAGALVQRQQVVAAGHEIEIAGDARPATRSWRRRSGRGGACRAGPRCPRPSPSRRTSR